MRDMEQLLALRGQISQAIESAQKNGALSGTLEARIDVQVPAGSPALALANSELEEIFILSDLRLKEGAEASVEISKTPFVKCERCWRHREEVAAHGTLCARCSQAVESVLTGAQ